MKHICINKKEKFEIQFKLGKMQNFKQRMNQHM